MKAIMPLSKKLLVSKCAMKSRGQLDAITKFCSLRAMRPRTMVSSTSESCETNSANKVASAGSDPNGSSGFGKIVFDQREFLKRQDTKFLLGAFSAYMLFSTKAIVENSQCLYQKAKRIFGRTISGYVIKSTVFPMFIGGENSKEVREIALSLQKKNIRSIIDYSVEFSAIDDSGQESLMQDEQEEKVLKTFDECIDVASRLDDAFVALKITAICNDKLLRKMTSVINIRNAFSVESDKEAAQHLLKAMYGIDSSKVSTSAISNMRDFQNLFGSESFEEFFVLSKEYPCDFCLTKDEVEAAKKAAALLVQVVQKAADKNVRVFVDAEQTYFQPAIDYFTTLLQRKFNKERAVVFGTIQTYLKTSKQNLEKLLEYSRKNTYVFAYKVVCGAYMKSERKLALDNKTESPIYQTHEETVKNYLDCIDIANSRLVIATHNKKLIEKTIEKTSDFDKSNLFYFQKMKKKLYGMSDYITYKLAEENYKVYKYLPFGDVHEVMPYLLRRIEENTSVASKMKEEYDSLKQEIKRRTSIF